MTLDPTSWFPNLSPELATVIISMIPVTELRASIPIGIEVYDLPVMTVWILAVIGDIIPALVLLLLFPRMHDWLVRTKFLGAIFTKKLEQAEKMFSGKYTKYGAIGLIIFVGIPLPLTGSWTGSLAAFVFGIPFKKSAPLIAIGVCVAATLVTLITLFAGGALRAIF